MTVEKMYLISLSICTPSVIFFFLCDIKYEDTSLMVIQIRCDKGEKHFVVKTEDV